MADMTAPPSFLDKFGGSTANVDYTDDPSKQGGILPIPLQGDSLATLETKMRNLARVVERGASVARFTGMMGTPQQSRDALQTAKMRMTEVEKEMFSHWEAGGRLPDVNWGTDVDAMPSGSEPRRKAEIQAEALNRLYKTDAATAGHVVHWKKTFRAIIPLLVSMTKVVGSERDFLGGQDVLDANEMAEVQTIGKVNGTTYASINAIQEEVHRLLSSINRSKDLLQAREHALKAKNPKYKVKQSPANDARQLLGKRRLGADVDFSADPIPERRVRRNLALGVHQESVPIASRAGEQRAPTRGGINQRRPHPDTDPSADMDTQI
ncbi:35 kDa protein [Penicillium aurantiogriseum bipartite virus 1]|uniref:35 kDa protein n=1 Tax=Penicillium aurantiogriseum bipartite virus 1 TaxID=1755754 RepID=UPI00071AD010|nr:35 kDa protein [Penicillium aurantiogriseum bipartite virus 1]ALO50129.1 35 kDa protein [Penicillium aurantiogriseum bipartite virus 1]